MKFRILDLFLATTFAAVVFAAFKHDLVAFRQLVLFALISIGAVVVSLIGVKKNRQFVGGAVGGSVGSVAYLAIAIPLRHQFYDALWFPNGLIDQWVHEATWVPLLAPAIGAAIGPLLTSHLKNVELTTNAKRDRLISWGLLGGVVLLLFFKMNDRVAMIYGERDWSAIIALLLIGFIVHTIHWNWQSPSA